MVVNKGEVMLEVKARHLCTLCLLTGQVYVRSGKFHFSDCTGSLPVEEISWNISLTSYLAVNKSTTEVGAIDHGIHFILLTEVLHTIFKDFLVLKVLGAIEQFGNCYTFLVIEYK